MKKQTTFLVCCLFAAATVNAQLPSLGKAKGLLGSKSKTSDQSNQSSGSSNGSSSGGSQTSTPAKANTPVSSPVQASPAENSASMYFSGSYPAQKGAGASFKDGDMIYARVDFTQAMKDIGGNKYHDVFIINLFDGDKFLNGKKLSFLKDEDMAKNYFEFQVTSSLDAAKSPLAQDFTKTLAQQLSSGKHTIKVKMIRLDGFNNEFKVGESSFDLDLSAGKQKLQDLAYTYDKAEIEARRMPKAVMHNAAIEKDLMSIISNDFTEPVTPLRAVIDNSDWDIQRDDDNKIIRRVIGGYVAVKVPRSGRCFYKKIYIYQPYTGGGTYGKSKYYDNGYPTDLNEIDCANVMK